MERTGVEGAERAAGAPAEEARGGEERIGRCLLPGDVEGIAEAVREEDRLGEEREKSRRFVAEALVERGKPPRLEKDAPEGAVTFPAPEVLYRVRFAEPVRFRESHGERIRRNALVLFISAAGLAAGWWIGLRLWKGPLGEMLLPEIGETEVAVRRTAAPPAPPWDIFGPPLPAETAPGPGAPFVETPAAEPSVSPPAEAALSPAPRSAQVPPAAGRETGDAPAGPLPVRWEGRIAAVRVAAAEEAERSRAVRALARSIERAGQGDWNGAAADAERAFAIDPTLARAANQAAALSLRSGRWEEAERWSRAAIAADRNHAGARANMGAALIEQGRAEEAARVFAGAIRLNRRDWRAWAGLAASLEESGRAAEAIEAHGRAVRFAPDRPELHYNRAIALDGAGRTGEAALSFREYLSLSAGRDPAREERVRLWLADHGD